MRPPRGPLNRSAARNAVLLNQCATPGLGSLMAGRRVAGVGQLLLAVAGFCLVLAWFALLAMRVYNALINDVETTPVNWPGEAGAAFFVVAWLWSLVTSLSILREARTAQPPALATPGAVE